MSEHVMNRMTEEEYRSHPGVNKSTLWEIRKSPKHYKWALENPTEDTPALKMGRAIHMAVLQPDEFCEHYAIIPDGIDRRTKEGKEAWKTFVERHEGKEFLTVEENDSVVKICNAVREECGELIDGCQTEVPLFWDDPRTGIACKCRVDAMTELKDKFLMIDLKTTNDAGTDVFVRSAVTYGYHVQAAHYMNGAVANGLNHDKPVEWWFVAVEKAAPYAVNIIKVTDRFVDEGQFRLMGLMDRLDECLRTGSYPGYGTSVMDMPAWAMEGEEAED